MANFGYTGGAGVEPVRVDGFDACVDFKQAGKRQPQSQKLMASGEYEGLFRHPDGRYAEIYLEWGHMYKMFVWNNWQEYDSYIAPRGLSRYEF